MNLSAQAKYFITRNGDRLMDGGQEFRFISFNTPNLHYIEDYLPFSGTNPWRLPDEFEIRDALMTIKQIGGKVTRMYVLSVRRQDDTPDIVRHVEAPGKFNEDAFRALDKVLQIANELDVRVIIPFVDNWRWWGGVAEYAAFRGKEREAFWTDPEIIADMKKTIEFIINRKNTYTGTLYKDDKAIMAWETGNELRPPFSWTRQIAAYVKSLDTNHLVMEGTIVGEVTQEAIDDPDIDILSTHHYRDVAASIVHIVKNRAMTRGKKPYVVGEYGIVPTQDIRMITDTIIHQGISGGMLWSLRFRNREGGFYNHYEYSNTAAYRWPGYPNGDVYDERMVLSIIREKAFEIDGATEPRLPVPARPTLLPFRDVSSISWQGSVGARSYSLERSAGDTTGWEMIAQGIDESRYQCEPLFNDDGAEFGKKYFYRVRAKNESGFSDYSNVVGPVEVTTKFLVDEMGSFDRVFQKDGDLRVLTFQDIRRAKEDRARLAGADGSYVIYKIPIAAVSLTVDAFRSAQGSDIAISVDSTMSTFTDLQPRVEVFKFGANDYGFFDAVSYTMDQLPARTRFVKISLTDGIQVARVEISYSPVAKRVE
jgi:hypothetical protein